MKDTPLPPSGISLKYCLRVLAILIPVAASIVCFASLSIAQAQSLEKLTVVQTSQAALTPGEGTVIIITNLTASNLFVELLGQDTSYGLLVSLMRDAKSSGHGDVDDGVATGQLSVRLPAGTYTVEAYGGSFEKATFTVAGRQKTMYLVGLCPPIPTVEHTVCGAPVALSSKSDSVSATIDRIAKGSHQELPPPTQTPTALGQSPGWTIENATGYQLHLYLSGPTEHEYVIPNGNSINLDLPPGSYRMAAEVSSKNVTPFYALRQLDSGTRWKSKFYISQK